MPSADPASLAAVNLTETLLHPNHEAQFVHIGETQLEALRQLETLFQAHWNKHSAPSRVVHISPFFEEPAPAIVDTPAPAKAAHGITAPSPRVATKNTCTHHTICLQHIIQGPIKENQYDNTGINDHYIHLNIEKRTHLFSVLGFTEGQCRLKEESSSGQ